MSLLRVVLISIISLTFFTACEDVGFDDQYTESSKNSQSEVDDVADNGAGDTGSNDDGATPGDSNDTDPLSPPGELTEEELERLRTQWHWFRTGKPAFAMNERCDEYENGDEIPGANVDSLVEACAARGMQYIGCHPRDTWGMDYVYEIWPSQWTPIYRAFLCGPLF